MAPGPTLVRLLAAAPLIAPLMVRMPPASPMAEELARVMGPSQEFALPPFSKAPVPAIPLPLSVSGSGLKTAGPSRWSWAPF